MKTKIVKVGKRFFVDYEKGDGWKNYSNHHSYDDAIKSQHKLRSSRMDHTTEKELQSLVGDLK